MESKLTGSSWLSSPLLDGEDIIKSMSGVESVVVVDGYDPTETAKVQPIQQIKRYSKWLKLAVMVVIPTILLMIPHTEEISDNSWQLLCIFVGLIVGVVLQPVPMAAVAVCALAVAMISKTLTMEEAFQAYSTTVPWLIASAVMMSSAVRESGLGSRLGYLFVSMSSGPISLAYALNLSELILAPAIPSVVARSGSVILPIVTSTSQACNSFPNSHTADYLGGYLILTTLHSSVISSTCFLTSSNVNALSSAIAYAVTGFDMNWGVWAMGAFLPGLISWLLCPLLAYVLHPPKLSDISQARLQASQKLREQGPLTQKEIVVMLVLIGTIGLWMAGPWLNLDPVAAGFTGLSVLLIGGILNWKDCASNDKAWSIFVWQAAIIGMANQLTSDGVMGLIGSAFQEKISYAQLPWQGSLSIVLFVYVISHYLFPGNPAHVSSLLAISLQTVVALGAPGSLAALLFCYFSVIMGSISTYGMANSVMFFDEGYVKFGKGMAVGGIFCAIYSLIWATVGTAWWKFLGLW